MAFAYLAGGRGGGVRLLISGFMGLGGGGGVPTSGQKGPGWGRF